MPDPVVVAESLDSLVLLLSHRLPHLLTQLPTLIPVLGHEVETVAQHDSCGLSCCHYEGEAFVYDIFITTLEKIILEEHGQEITPALEFRIIKILASLIDSALEELA